MAENKNCASSGSCSKSSCEGCSSKKTDFSVAPHELSNIKKVIGVVSGKGGVGKSMVTSLLAVTLKNMGYSVGVLDADITGPSIPKAFGIHEKAMGNENGILPVYSKAGIPVMSINLLLPDETDPVIWRGPVIAGTVKQFWSDVVWGDLDFLLVDMPPGTGDVSLTVFQNLPVDGIIIVTTPQDLVTMIVKKAYNMAKLMDIPILGIVENMSYAICPDCGKEINIFGESKADEVAKELDVPVLARIPIDPKTTALVDKGAVELADGKYLNGAVELIERTFGND